MTRVRPPLSIDAAIARIMAELGGWPAVAEAAGVASPRACEKWGAYDIAEVGDPENRDIPMRAAVRLDIAYQAAGGTGAPILEAYADLVKVAAAENFGDKLELQRDVIALIGENSDAEVAALEASLPSAGPAEEERAQRELLEARGLIDRILLRLKRKPP